MFIYVPTLPLHAHNFLVAEVKSPQMRIVGFICHPMRQPCCLKLARALTMIVAENGFSMRIAR